MQRIYNWLIPTLLWDLDGYLLENHPVVWCTKVHYVLFYSLILSPVLFLIGFLMPVSATDLPIPPIEPISLFEKESLTFVFLILLIGAGGYRWMTLRNNWTARPQKPAELLQTGVIYVFCFYLLLGVTLPSFRLGTIYNTAWHWMDEKDIQYYAENIIQKYGYVENDADSTLSEVSDSFFAKREAAFQKLCKIEDALLQNRYNPDTAFWFDLIRKSTTTQRDSRHYRSYLKLWYKQKMVEIPSYLAFERDFDIFCYGFWPEDQYRNSKSFSLYKFFRWNGEPDQQYREFRYESYDLSLSKYQDYFNKKINPGNIAQTSAYQFDFVKDSFNVDVEKIGEKPRKRADVIDLSGDEDYSTVTILRPRLPYSVENAVRSVQNARQFWEKGIYWDYLARLFYLVLLLSALLFFDRSGLNTLFTGLLFFIWLALNDAQTHFDAETEYDPIRVNWFFNTLAIALPIIGLSIMGYVIRVRKKFDNIYISTTLLFGIGLCSPFIILFLNMSFLHTTISIMPNYWVQLILGIIGIYGQNYIKSLPWNT